MFLKINIPHLRNLLKFKIFFGKAILIKPE